MIGLFLYRQIMAAAKIPYFQNQHKCHTFIAISIYLNSFHLTRLPFSYNAVPLLREHYKILDSYIVTLIFSGLAIWFIRHERGELQQVRAFVVTSRWDWITICVVWSIAYIFI